MYWFLILFFLLVAFLEYVIAGLCQMRLTIFSFKHNYNTWTRLSWFSVILLTLLIYIVLFPVLVSISFVELFCMIFLRKEDE